MIPSVSVRNWTFLDAPARQYESHGSSRRVYSHKTFPSVHAVCISKKQHLTIHVFPHIWHTVDPTSHAHIPWTRVPKRNITIR
ncbi:hypothetical protein SJAG_06420 [Schizosaccharomyces japonicus yFS275]|uniref:Uncharacterized protein n=1 Tax=Schizosaccharomyces japonicus (strain yFS275 / FY16936) TaxID=402676 RepID=T0S333_SCHJY|nr:hypothetical protein SJAG_06420 [Schizosaccharomyces japonicus yFS275]EQC53026.1 hypothetical protein SJAG_06420 [Schizosaccharomyces japonicus yFS275]